MMNRDEVLAWVQSLDPNDCIGIDEGGLCLRQVLPDDTLGEAYCEVGGIPQAIEDGHPPCEHCGDTATLLVGEARIGVCGDCFESLYGKEETAREIAA